MKKYIGPLLLVFAISFGCTEEKKTENTEERLKYNTSTNDGQELGVSFSKKDYVPEQLPAWEETKDQLPQPILGDNEDWIKMYWKTWRVAFKSMRQPVSGSPLVSNYYDESFSEAYFQWDTFFMMMYGRYGHDVFPAIQSLDNFYCRQRESGYIGRCFYEKDGGQKLAGAGKGEGNMKNTINPPLFSWTEVESYRVTGDKSRFEMILPVLEKYAAWLNQEGNPDEKDWEANGRMSTAEHKLFWNTPLGSGMDNTPRPAENGAGWVEMSSQMVIMYNNLAIICDELNETKKAKAYRKEAKEIGERINKWCWNEDDGFYYDVLADGTQFKKKTLGGFWPMLAGIPSEAQLSKMVAHLKNENEFWRKNVFPTLSADEEEYYEFGDYWCGGVWAPTNVMVIKGLEKNGYHDFAAEASERYINGMSEVYKHTWRIWENYAPDHYAPGQPSRRDFVGWSGCGPIQLLFENVMGIQPNGADNTLVWRLRRTDKHGVENLKLGDNTVSVICAERETKNSPASITVICAMPFELKIIQTCGEQIFKIEKGKHILKIN